MIARSVDVAQRAGVSRATVSQVLNGHADRFAPETAARVLEAAAELGYQPSAAGRTLRRGSSDFVLALIPNTTFGGNLQDLFERMGQQLAQRGFTLVLRIASPAVESLDRVVVGMMPAAVISLTSFSAEERAMLDRRGVVGIDPPSSAQIDHNRMIGQIQGRALVAGGYRRLAFAHLQDARQDPFGAAREQGVRDAAVEAGLDDIQVVRTDIDLEDAAFALAALEPKGVAVACYNDDVAMTLLSAATLAGWSIPSDLALIGMDRTPLSQVTVPRLATIEYDLDASAEQALRSVLAALGEESEDLPTAPVPLTVVPGETL